MRRFYPFNSGGNDSVAVLCHLVELELPARAQITALYSNTGWAKDGWQERVDRIAEWCRTHGILHDTIYSKGFSRLVLEEGNAKGEPPGRFPTGLQKFCTRHLKILPARRWLEENDFEKVGIAVTGVRREESERRKNAPAFVPASEDHGWRPLWQPLVEMESPERDALLLRHGWEPLPHRSDECEPCIFSNRDDLRRVSPEKVETIRGLEKATGKVMFRPRAYAGAEGIDEVMRWAWSDRGQYKPEDRETEEAVLEDATKGCDSDWCGS